ncbi:MAG: hypothetical protein ACRDLV_01355 [Solirubrobacteraceae bacterium]
MLAGFDEAGLLLGGFRERPGHLDLLTIALPPTDVQGDHPPPEARSAEEGTWVDLTENFAIEHTGIDQPSDGSIIGSSVQLVIIVPGSHQGAVITAQSTESGVEADLETSARYVADSMRLLPAVPTS